VWEYSFPPGRGHLPNEGLKTGLGQNGRWRSGTFLCFWGRKYSGGKDNLQLMLFSQMPRWHICSWHTWSRTLHAKVGSAYSTTALTAAPALFVHIHYNSKWTTRRIQKIHISPQNVWKLRNTLKNTEEKTRNNKKNLKIFRGEYKFQGNICEIPLNQPTEGNLKP
jgi:hypothetical protein